MTASEETVTTEEMIVCRDVHKWFGSFHALKGVSTTINRGEVVVVFGPSGSGKSTFIRTINRLEEHQRGDIIVDGIELTNDVRNIEAIRSEVGMVFQSFNLFPHLTVLDNIIAGADKSSQVAEGQGAGSGHGPARAGWASPNRRASSPASFRAVSSSAWQSRAPWQCSRRSCSSTSRHPRSTRR